MTILSLFNRLFARSIARDRMRRSFAPLLDPTDDRLLDDLGVTRAELEAMIGNPLIPTYPLPANVRFTPAAAFGAGSSRRATSGSSRPI